MIGACRKQLMGFAALAIYFFHVGPPQYPEGSLPGTVASVVNPLLQYGTDIFFLLSGMGLVYAWEKTGRLKDFWIRRAERILLPIWLSGTIVAIQQGWGVEQYVRNVSGINFYARHVFSYSWFYAAIITLYILFPFYYRFFRRARNHSLFALVTWGVWILLSVLLRGLIREDLYIAINRLGIFVLGILLGRLAMDQRMTKLKFVHYTAGVVTAISGFIMMSLALENRITLPVPYGYMWLPASMAAIGSVIVLSGIFGWLQEQKHFVPKCITRFFGFYGMLSLEMICVQEWVGTMLERLNLTVGRFTELAILTVFAYAYYHANRFFLRLVNTCVQRREHGCEATECNG